MDSTTALEDSGTGKAAAAAEWQALLEDILPPQGQWTDEQYLVLTDHRNRLIELTDGVLEVLPMPTDKHQSILKFLFLAFFRFVEVPGGIVQFAPLRLQVRPGKYREPDLLVLSSATDPRRSDRFWTGADLAVEVVSPDKPGRDLVDKVLDYAEARVSEYWIVNPVSETITIYELTGSTYRNAGEYGRGAKALSVLLAGFSVVVNDVLDAR